MSTDTRLISHLSRKSVIVLCAKVLNFIAILGSIIIVARLLSRDVFGRYQQCWLVFNTLTPILILGAPQGLNFFIPRAATARDRALICWRFFAMMFGVGLAFLVLFFLYPKLPAIVLGNPRLTPLVKPLALFIFFMLPSYCLESLLVINERPTLLLVINFFYTVIFIGIHVFFGLAASLEWLFIALAFLALIKTLLTVGYTRSAYPAPLRLSEILNPIGIRILGYYILTLTSIAAVDVLTVQIDKYLVVWFYRARESVFAVYSVGAVEIPLVGLILAAVGSVFMPELSRLLSKNETGHVLELIQGMTERLALIFLPLFFYLLFSGFRLVPFVFGDNYTGAVGVFSIYLFLIPLRMIVNHPLLIAAGLQRYALYGRLIDLAVNVTLGLLLLPVIGYLGPAVSTVVATYCHKIYQVGIVKRYLDVSLKDLYPWNALFTVFSQCGIFALFEVLVINLVVEPPLVSLILSAILFGGTIFIFYRKWFRTFI